MAKLKDLQKFVDSRGGNRGKAEFFVGRKDELAVIENACVQAIKRKTSPDRTEREGDPGGLLFAGAPGAGKSALLNECLGRVAGTDAGGNASRPMLAGIRKKLGLPEYEAPLVVTAAPRMMKREDSLLKLCAARAREISDDARRKTYLLAGEALATQSTKLDSEKIVDRLGEIDILRRPLVLILIDEAQNSTKENADLYKSLHLGLHPLPTVPVFAGLSDSGPALKKAGISRFARGHYLRLGSLSEEDCKEAMRTFLDRYEIDVGSGGVPFWEGFAVENSSLFPHHLNTVLIVAAERALAGNGKLDSSMHPEVAAGVEAYKREHYEERADGFTPQERKAAARIVTGAIHETKDPHETAANELGAIPTRSIGANGLPDVIGFVDRMVHSGMLQEIGQGRYECPIPSFALWLDRDYGDGRYARTAEAGGK